MDLLNIKLAENQDIHFDKIVTIKHSSTFTDDFGIKWILREFYEGGRSVSMHPDSMALLVS